MEKRGIPAVVVQRLEFGTATRNAFAGFGFPPEFGELLVEKGSVAVDGVSLTLVDVRADRFSVMLIPHTRQHTTLGQKPVGGAVNLEFDLLAKHVRKLVRGTDAKNVTG